MEQIRKAGVNEGEVTQTNDRTVNLGEEFPLFPPESTINKPDTKTGEYDMQHFSSITVIDPENGFKLPLSIHAFHSFDTDSGSISVDVKTTRLGSDLLTTRRKLRRKKVIPFIGSLRLVVSSSTGKSEELIPEINPKVDGISFYLPQALNEAVSGVGELKGRLFSITAENR
jgi:hypothetical protein